MDMLPCEVLASAHVHEGRFFFFGLQDPFDRVRPDLGLQPDLEILLQLLRCDCHGMPPGYYLASSSRRSRAPRRLRPRAPTPPCRPPRRIASLSPGLRRFERFLGWLPFPS